ncbi:MAG: hypothetical protein Q4E13_13470 [Clostridia bacterium]|nr:hypothetical protein [Clostridia bacterium]
MRRKIIHAVDRSPAPEAVYARAAAADDMLGTRFSPEEIVFPVGLHREYLPYAAVRWAYLRVEESRVTLGCCNGVIEDNRLMLVTADGCAVAVPFDRASYAEHALELVRRAAPHIAIGFTEDNRRKYAAI